MNRTWQALTHEAGLSAEHIAIGATALGRAHYAQTAYYAQAFFALSVGFERSCKLALVVHHALEHEGKFPDNDTVKRYRHDLGRLLTETDRIAEHLGLSAPDGRMPRSDVHRGIVDTLRDFATNVTRYYNFDFITGHPLIGQREDPIAAWWRTVTEPVLELHYKPHHREPHERRAREAYERFGPHIIVRSHAETGESIEDYYELARRNAMIQFARPWERMYLLQIARFLGQVLSQLGYAAQGGRLEDVPLLSEFFAIFNNGDAYFRKRKTWSIHRA